MTDKKRVKHLRQILLWPVYLLPLDENALIQDHWEHLSAPGPDNPWREIDDEFGDPGEFQARHYNEFVTFLPPVQRFLYGQGLGRAVRKVYGESPIEVHAPHRRAAGAHHARARATRRSMLEIAHVDLYFFFDIDIVILAARGLCRRHPFETRAGAAVPLRPRLSGLLGESGRGGHCPWKVEWLGDGRQRARGLRLREPREVPLVRLPPPGAPRSPRTGSFCSPRSCSITATRRAMSATGSSNTTACPT